MRCQIPAPSTRKLLFSIAILSLTIAGVACMSSASNDDSKDSNRGEMEQTGDIKIALILENTESLGYPDAKIVITNESKQVFCIRYDREPLQYLNLIVRNAHHRIVSNGYSGDIFSKFGKDRQVCLKPNEVYESSVDLFETLKKENRKPGQYFIQAIYTYKDSDQVLDRYKGREYKSNTVKVTLREEK